MGEEEAVGGTPVVWAVKATPEQRVMAFAVGFALALVGLMTIVPPSGISFYPWISAPICFLGSMSFIARAFDPRPRLLVDDQGITDRTSWVTGTLHVPWDEVEGVREGGWGSGTVELHVRDLAHVRRRTGWLRRVWMGLERLVGKRTVTLSPFLLGVRKRDLAAALDAGLARHERVRLGLPVPDGPGPQPPPEGT